MRRLLLAVLGIVVAGLVVAELAMRPTPGDRLRLGSIYTAGAVVTVAAAAAGRRRFSRLRTSLRVVSLGAVAVVATVVVLAASTMVLDAHARNVVLVAVGLATGLALTLSLTISRRVEEDLSSLGEVARRVAAGDLSARAGVRRRDELGELAGAFDAMVARLGAVDEERRLLFHALGHDLRTPLTSIRVTVEAIEDGVETDVSSAARRIRRDIGILERLLDDLVLLARLESGSFPPVVERVDFVELAHEACEAMTAIAERSGVTLRLAGDGPAPGSADPTLLGRVLRNLLDNAVRHSPPAGTVTVAVSREASGTTILVSDEGPGFSPELGRTVFEPFVQADDARSRKGHSGLGLAISSRIVTAHGGRLGVEDGPGGRVVVELDGSEGGGDGPIPGRA